MSEFKWRHFEGEIILWAVRWYCRYGISYRDLEQMMGERGVPVDHSTIYRWVQKFAPEIEKRLRWQWRRPRSTSWRVDETYVKVRGKWAYLYRGLCCKILVGRVRMGWTGGLVMSEFKWRHFEGEIILWAVRWYCRYGISYRDLEQMMGERGVPVDHSTIYRWVQKFAPEIEKRLRWQWRRPRSTSWRVDETYVKVRGKWAYLYRGLCCKILVGRVRMGWTGGLVMSEFKWRHFEGEIILWAVRWYCRYGISYRDLEQMMGERGVPVDHSTIYRWVQKFAPEIEKRLRWQWRRPRSTSWRVDETYVKVRGKWAYLYRALDKEGNTIDFYLSPTRNAKASKRFLGKALNGLKAWEKPEVINTDKAPTYALAISELKAEGKCPQETLHRQVKYLNNVVEADHGKLKQLIRPVRGFKTLKTAYATIMGFEVMRALRKGQAAVFNLTQDIRGEARIVERAFGIGAIALAEAVALIGQTLETQQA